MSLMYNPPHPGIVLREYLGGMEVSKAAMRLNVSRTTLSRVLKARGHEVRRLPRFGMSGCATAVMIDPATGNRFAAGDPRRDCYAMAY